MAGYSGSAHPTVMTKMAPTTENTRVPILILGCLYRRAPNGLNRCLTESKETETLFCKKFCSCLSEREKLADSLTLAGGRGTGKDAYAT